MQQEDSNKSKERSDELIRIFSFVYLEKIRDRIEEHFGKVKL